MGKSSPSPPAGVDPVALSKAQTTSNIQTANALAQLNRISQTTPFGTTTYTQTKPQPGPATTTNSDGSTNSTLTQDQIDGGVTQTTNPGTVDPNAVDQWSQSTTLSPEQQQILEGQQNQQRQGQIIAASAEPGLASQPKLTYGVDAPTLQTTLAQGNVPQPGQIQSSLDFSGAPAMPTADTEAQKAVVDALYGQSTSRLDPQWQQDQTRLETKLADQGVVQGSDAWTKMMDEFQRNKTDAYSTARNSAIGEGTNTLTQLSAAQLAARQQGVNEAATQGAFANSAEGQQFGQQLSAEQQAEQERLSSATFANEALQQMFGNSMANANLNNSSSQMNLQDLLSKYGLGTGSISMPQMPGVPGSNIAPTDVIGAQGLSTNAAMAKYQADMQNNSAAKGGAGSLLGTGAMAAALAFSDRRLKRDMQIIGRAENGLPIYAFRYLDSEEPEIGLMAQDVEKIHPSAVHTIGGFKAVEYPAALAA